VVEICAPWLALGDRVKRSIAAEVGDWVKRHLEPKPNALTSRIVAFYAPDGKFENLASVDGAGD